MPLTSKSERDALKRITSDLQQDARVLNDILPRMTQVLQDNDIHLIKHKADKEGWAWAITDFIDFYRRRAIDLQPLIEALREVKFEHLAEKLQNLSLETGDTSGPNTFEQSFTELQTYLKNAYKTSYAKLRPLPQINRVFDIKDIWVNLQFENRTELKAPEDYRECMLAAFKENKLLAVKGHQGMGKTTNIRRVAFDWASGDLPQFDLVLVARYRDLKNNRETALELALDWMGQKKYLTPQHVQLLRANKEKFDSKVYGGVRLLLLIDGLDEAKVKCTELDQALESDDLVHLNYHILLTSRPAKLDLLLFCPIPIAFIVVWNFDYVMKYIKAHFLQYVREKGMPFCEVLNNTVSVLHFLATHPHPIAQVPLHITFICLLQEDGELKPGMSSSLLHRKLCHALVRRQAPLYPQLQTAFQKDEFGRVAHCEAVRNLALLTFDSLVKGVGIKQIFIYDHLRKKAVDVEMCLKVGFLQTDDEGQGAKYEFLGVSLQYYLSAELLLAEFRKVPPLKFERSDFSVPDSCVLDNEEVLDQSLILRELVRCAKIESLEPMICYLLEMALEASRHLALNVGTFLISWNYRHVSFIGANVRTLDLMLQLGNKTDVDFFHATACTAIAEYHHSARSLLSLVRNQSEVVRVHECGICLIDISVLIFCSQPIATHTPVVSEWPCSVTQLFMCLLEEGAFESFVQACRRMGWTELIYLRAKVGPNRVQELKSRPRLATKISQVDLDFSHPTHSVEITPIVQRLLSVSTFNALHLRNASIGDLGSAFNDQRLIGKIKVVELCKVSLQNPEDLTKFARLLASFTCLSFFQMNNCTLGGPQLIDLLSKLTSSRCCTDLQLAAMACLREQNTFTQFCSLLPTWPNLARLALNDNNLSANQIEQLIEATKTLKLTFLCLEGNPKFQTVHMQRFKHYHPEMGLLTH